MPRTIHTPLRLFQTIWVYCRFLLSPLSPGRHRNARPEALRLALERLGSAFVKLGQALALRFDLLPAEYCEALLKIRNEIKPVAFSTVRRIVKDELGRFPEELFASFEREPFAVTSTGQIHKAMARDGTLLAVKVQNASIRRQFAVDLRLMRWWARPLDRAGIFGASSVRGFIDDFSRSLSDELDFQTAARHADRLSALAIDHGPEVNAAVRPEYSTRHVLTWEFIEGISVLAILDAVHRSDHAFLDDLADRGYDRAKIARRIYWSMLNQIYRDGMFHSDLSPAGILVLPGNVIAHVDFAVIGRVTEELQDSLRFYVQCLMQDNIEAAVDEFQRWLSPSSSTDIARFRRDLTTTLEDYLDGFRSPVNSAPRRTASHYAVNVMSVIRRHGLSASPGLALYLRTLLTLDAIVFELSPAYDPLADQNRFFARAASLDVMDLLRPEQVFKAAAGYYEQAKQVFTDFRRLQYSGRSIGISLRTLQVRLLQSGLWALLIGGVAYLGFRDEAFRPLQTALGIGDDWIPAGLLAVALIVVAVMLRQGRRLAAIDRSATTGRDVSRRSFGRVR